MTFFEFCFDENRFFGPKFVFVISLLLSLLLCSVLIENNAQKDLTLSIDKFPEFMMEFGASKVKYISSIFLSCILNFLSINFSSYYLNSKYGIGSLKNTDILFKIIIFFLCLLFFLLVAYFFLDINFFDFTDFPISAEIYALIILIIGLIVYDLLLLEIPRKLEKPSPSISYSTLVNNEDKIEYSVLLDKYGKNIPLSRVKEIKEKSTNEEENDVNKTKNNRQEQYYYLIAFVVLIISYFIVFVDWGEIGNNFLLIIPNLIRGTIFSFFWTFILYLPYSMIFEFRKLSELRSTQLLGLLNLIVIAGFSLFNILFLMMFYADYVVWTWKIAVLLISIVLISLFFLCTGTLYKLKMEKFK